MHKFFLFVLLGISAGFIAASITGFKDAPYENFKISKFFRSFITGALAGLIFYYLDYINFLRFDNLGILVLCSLAFERGLGELYKGFFKKKNHPEYVHALNRLRIPLDSWRKKLLLALVVILIFVVITFFSAWLIDFVITNSMPVIAKGAIAGFLAGLIVAIGGGTKDAQFEGFDIYKFFRSPLAGMFVGAFLVHFIQVPILLILSGIGLERIIVDGVYKTYITRRLRGIHEKTGVLFPEWFYFREVLLFTYCCNVLLFIGLLLDSSGFYNSPVFLLLFLISLVLIVYLITTIVSKNKIKSTFLAS